MILDVCKRFEIKIRDVCAKPEPAKPETTKPEPAPPVKPKDGYEEWDDDAWKWWKGSWDNSKGWSEYPIPFTYEWPGDTLRSQLSTAARWGSVSDALDVAKTCGKIKDKCYAPPYPKGNDETQLELWSFKLVSFY